MFCAIDNLKLLLQEVSHFLVAAIQADARLYLSCGRSLATTNGVATWVWKYNAL